MQTVPTLANLPIVGDGDTNNLALCYRTNSSFHICVFFNCLTVFNRNFKATMDLTLSKQPNGNRNILCGVSDVYYPVFAVGGKTNSTLEF